MSQNTWPSGYRHAIDQDGHKQWNESHYPGTRQMCVLCDEPTGRCEEDSIRVDTIDGPLCETCYHETPEWILENVDE